MKKSTKKTREISKRLDRELDKLKGTIAELTKKLSLNYNPNINISLKTLQVCLSNVTQVKDDILILEKQGLHDYQYQRECKAQLYLEKLMGEDPTDNILRTLHEFVLRPTTSAEAMELKIKELAAEKPYYLDLVTVACADILVKKEGKLPEIVLLFRCVINIISQIYGHCDIHLKRKLSKKDNKILREILFEIYKVSLEIHDYDFHQEMGILVYCELFCCIFYTYDMLYPNNVIYRRDIFSNSQSLNSEPVALNSLLVQNSTQIESITETYSNKIVRKIESESNLHNYFIPKNILYEKLKQLFKLAESKFNKDSTKSEYESLKLMIEPMQDILYDNYFSSNRSVESKQDLIDFYDNAILFINTFRELNLELSYTCYANLISSIIEPRVESCKQVFKFINPLLAKIKNQTVLTMEEKIEISRAFQPLVNIIEALSKQFSNHVKKHIFNRNLLFAISQILIDLVIQHELPIHNPFAPFMQFFYEHREHLSENQILTIKSYVEKFKQYPETDLFLLKLTLSLSVFNDLSTPLEIYIRLNNSSEKNQIRPDLLHFLNKADIKNLAIDDTIYFLEEMAPYTTQEIKLIFCNLTQNIHIDPNPKLIDFFKKNIETLVRETSFINYMLQNKIANYFIDNTTPILTIDEDTNPKSVDIYKEYLAYLKLDELCKQSLPINHTNNPDIDEINDNLSIFFANFQNIFNQTQTYLPSEQLSTLTLLHHEMDLLVNNLKNLKHDNPDLYLSYTKKLFRCLNSTSFDLNVLLNLNSSINNHVVIKSWREKQINKLRYCQEKLDFIKTAINLQNYSEALQEIYKLEMTLGGEIFINFANQKQIEELRFTLATLKGDCFYKLLDMNAALNSYLVALMHPAAQKDILQLKIKTAFCFFKTRNYFATLRVIDEIIHKNEILKAEKTNLQLLKFRSLLALKQLSLAEKFILNNFKDQSKAEYSLVNGLLAHKQKNDTLAFKHLADAYIKKPNKIYYLHTLINLYKNSHTNEIISLAEKSLYGLDNNNYKAQIEIKILILKQKFTDALEKIEIFNTMYPEMQNLTNFDKAICYIKSSKNIEALNQLKSIHYFQNPSILPLLIELCDILNLPEVFIFKINEALNSCQLLDMQHYKQSINYCVKYNLEGLTQDILRHATQASLNYPSQLCLPHLINYYEEQLKNAITNEDNSHASQYSREENKCQTHSSTNIGMFKIECTAKVPFFRRPDALPEQEKQLKLRIDALDLHMNLNQKSFFLKHIQNPEETLNGLRNLVQTI